jgi:hypothetical protein
MRPGIDTVYKQYCMAHSLNANLRCFLNCSTTGNRAATGQLNDVIAGLSSNPHETQVNHLSKILVAPNAIKITDNEMINLIKLHYLLFEFHSTRPKFGRIKQALVSFRINLFSFIHDVIFSKSF